MKLGLNTVENGLRDQLRKHWCSMAATRTETIALHYHNLGNFGLLLFGFIAAELFKAPRIGAGGYATATLFCGIPFLLVIVDLFRQGWNRSRAGVLIFAAVNVALTATVICRILFR